jgi:hypothetical protein
VIGNACGFEAKHAGQVAKLAGLPRLREVHFSGPQLTREAAAAFPAHVHAEYAVG